MSLARTRMDARYSNYKLRRARRLYGFLCSRAIHAQPESAIPLAFRAIRAGLYSENTSVNNVCFSLIRHAYKNHSSKNQWWQWAEENGASHIWHQCSHYYRKHNGILKVIKKPRVRISTCNYLKAKEEKS